VQVTEPQAAGRQKTNAGRRQVSAGRTQKAERQQASRYSAAETRQATASCAETITVARNRGIQERQVWQNKPNQETAVETAGRTAENGETVRTQVYPGYAADPGIKRQNGRTAGGEQLNLSKKTADLIETVAELQAERPTAEKKNGRNGRCRWQAQNVVVPSVNHAPVTAAGNQAGIRSRYKSSIDKPMS